MNSDGRETDSFQKTCPSHECNGVKISYPFWLLDDTTSDQFCGYRGLGLNCSSTIIEGPILELPNDDYYFVKNIDYDTYTLTLVDIDLVDELECPRVRYNFSAETLPIYYSPLDLNLTFYYNCTTYFPPLIPNAIPVDCLASGSKKSYVLELRTKEPEGFEWYEYCEEKVVVPVMEKGIGSDGSVRGFGREINEGFMLVWQSMSECRACEAADGRCGYNNVAKEFLCFCSDGSIRNNNQSCKFKGMFNFFCLI